MLIAMAVYVLAIPALACHAAGYDLGDSAFAWSRPPLEGPGGSGFRLSGSVPDGAALAYAPEAVLDLAVPPLLAGLWGQGKAEESARNDWVMVRSLSLLRQVFRLDAMRLAGRGRVYASPDGFYPPRRELVRIPGTGPDDPGGVGDGPAVGPPVTVTAYAWPIAGELALRDGRAVRVEGRAAVQGWSAALALRLQDDAPPADLERLAAAAAFAWPEGLECLGPVAERELAGGRGWAHGSFMERSALNWSETRSWPFRTLAWSDGTWLVLRAEASGFPLDYASVDEQMHANAHAVWHLVPYRPEPWPLLGLGPQTPDLMLGPIADVIHPAPDLTPTVERCVATLPPEARAAPPPPLTAWKEARVGPAPALVERYLERPDLPESVCLRYDTSGGTRVTGLLRLGGVPGDLHDAHVWWTLGRDCLTVTVLPWNTGKPMWEGLEKRFRSEADSAVLTGLFGWRGRAISVVPATMGPAGDTEWVSLVPDPAHEVGLLERVRVGQTEWGRCRVYKGYGIYHIVFDLLPEDVADR